MSENSWYSWDGDTLTLELRVQPRAGRDGITGVHGDRLKIRLTAPPVDGKANAHLVRFLAREFGVPRSQVTLLAGQSGREKRVQIRAPRRRPPDIPAYGM